MGQILLVYLVHLRDEVAMASGECWLQACLCSLLLWSPDKLLNVSALLHAPPSL